MKYKTSKLKQLEKERFSLFCDGTYCCKCGSSYNLTWHEIFEGRNRQNSMRYGLCLRLCLDCHRKITNDNDFLNEWHKKGQTKFEEVYPELDFLSIFYKNYL